MTPMMKQFMDLKDKNPDAILLFRCGDFYETYCEDAVTTADITGITLTKRNNGGKGTVIEMAGFPHHALDTYLPKLIRAGHRVAICDQLEDPKLTKKLVKRGITELVTPGVAMGDNVLNYDENNFLAALHFNKNVIGIAFLDISTGEFLTAEGTSDYIDKLLGNFSPKEVLFRRGYKELFQSTFDSKLYTFEMDDWVFTESQAYDKLIKHFDTKNLKGFGIEHLRNGIVAAGAILQYLEMTQHTQIGHITSISRIEEDKYVRLDKFTIRSLELMNTMNEGGNSLLSVIDRTISPMGARMLKRWIVFPLKSVSAINERLDVVEYFFREPDFKECITEQMQLVGDIERIISKVATGRVSPRELVQLKIALQATQPIKSACEHSANDRLKRIGELLNDCSIIRERIAKEIVNDPPLLVAKGGVIADGVNAELDELRRIAFSGKDYLLQIQQREIEATGISSLKIGYNNVFGYYIEVRNTYRDQVPPEWIRKQTLVSSERYVTEELKEYERKILSAEGSIYELEAGLYAALVADIQKRIKDIQSNCRVVSQLDVLQGFALQAIERNYCRPVMDKSLSFEIKAGRHPVIETLMAPGEQYVPNDIAMDSRSEQIMVLTGPNMAGKSALLRQTALIVLMAQTGSFVPAQAARIGVFDKIFTRVGATDNISRGESTFMVEMLETSMIMHNLSERSLVLMDEIGRGTSTYDGMSIARALIEYVHERGRGAKTLFATHYHELNDMENHFRRVHNWHIAVKEEGHDVIFLRKLERGGVAHSFGIHVARLAGMPQEVIRSAERTLRELERREKNAEALSKDTSEDGSVQLSFFQLDDPTLSSLREQLLGADLDNMTPLQAFDLLRKLKDEVGAGKN